MGGILDGTKVAQRGLFYMEIVEGRDVEAMRSAGLPARPDDERGPCRHPDPSKYVSKEMGRLLRRSGRRRTKCSIPSVAKASMRCSMRRSIPAPRPSTDGSDVLPARHRDGKVELPSEIKRRCTITRLKPLGRHRKNWARSVAIDAD